jgi:hypothetical protein
LQKSRRSQNSLVETLGCPNPSGLKRCQIREKFGN